MMWGGKKNCKLSHWIMMNQLLKLRINFLINSLAAHWNTNKNILSKAIFKRTQQKAQMLPKTTGFSHCWFQILFWKIVKSRVVNNLSIWNIPPKSESQLCVLWNISLSSRSLSHLHWSLVRGPSLRVDRSCKGPRLPSPQTTCLSLGLLACNLRQSSRSEVERVWLYVFDFDSHLSQCSHPEQLESPRAATLWGALLHEVVRFQTLRFYVLLCSCSICLGRTYCKIHGDIKSIMVWVDLGF